MILQTGYNRTSCKTLKNFYSKKDNYQANCFQYGFLQDTAAVDVSGEERRSSNHEPVESSRTHVPTSSVLPHQDTIPHSQDRAEREM